MSTQITHFNFHKVWVTMIALSVEWWSEHKVNCNQKWIFHQQKWLDAKWNIVRWNKRIYFIAFFILAIIAFAWKMKLRHLTEKRENIFYCQWNWTLMAIKEKMLSKWKRPLFRGPEGKWPNENTISLTGQLKPSPRFPNGNCILHPQRMVRMRKVSSEKMHLLHRLPVTGYRSLVLQFDKHAGYTHTANEVTGQMRKNFFHRRVYNASSTGKWNEGWNGERRK